MQEQTAKLGRELVETLKCFSPEEVVQFAHFVVDHAAGQSDEDAQAAVLELANVLIAVALKKLNVKPRPQHVTNAGGINSREVFGMGKKR